MPPSPARPVAAGFAQNRCLPQWEPVQRIQSQARLNGRVAGSLLPSAPSIRRWHPDHLKVKPDRQRSTLLQTVIVRQPVCRLVLRWGLAAHAFCYHDGFTT